MGSWDSMLGPHDLIKTAQERGLDGVTITEHGVQDVAALEQLKEEHDFLILGGVEVSTDLGDILVFGMGDFDVGYMEAPKLREMVLEAGGIMVAAHPFRRDFSPVGYHSHNPAQEINIEEACGRPIFELVDALEAANGGSTREEVLFSFQVMERLNMGGTGGSDAHTTRAVGDCVTRFDVELATEADLVEAIRNGACQPIDRRNHQG
jgi:hypothetical protein